MKKRLVPLLLCILLAGCGTPEPVSLKPPQLDANSVSVQNLGAYSYTMKTLDGLFFTVGDDLYLISGTETNGRRDSQVFVYHVEQDQVVSSQTLPGGASMTAFCDTPDDVFFATISASESLGCDLYAWNKTTEEIRKVHHFSEKGIYDLAWDGEQTLFVGTSHAPALYGYDLQTGSVRQICGNFSDGPYIRSLSYVNGSCYLGMGTQADLIRVDVATGAFQSVLPEMYRDISFVYSQAVHEDSIIFVLSSPALKILEYDTVRETLSDPNVAYGNTTIPAAETWQGPDTVSADLNGNLLFIKNGVLIDAFSNQAQTSCLDVENGVVHGLRGSGIYEQRSLLTGEVLFQKDFGSTLEKEYVAPVEFLVYDGTLYFPWSRFVVHDTKDGHSSIFLVEDEPQASTVTEEGIYTANYTECTLYFYPFETFALDSSKVSMNDPETFLLADITNQCRPTQMEVTPDRQYLITGSGPLYGHFGGAVSVYDLNAGSLLYTHSHVVENHQILSLTASKEQPGTVWLTTAPYGENSSPAYLEEPAHLILWEIETEEILLDIIPDERVKKIPSVVEIGDQVICVTRDGHLLSFDTKTGESLAENRTDTIYSALVTQNGNLIGISDTAFVSIDPESLSCSVLADGFQALNHITEDPVTGLLYACDNTEVIQVDLGIS